MKIYTYPVKEELDALLKRPVRDASELGATVLAVLQDVRERGDAAVKEYEERFDKVSLNDLAVSETEMQEAEKLVSEELKEAIRIAHHNIERFHAAQRFDGEAYCFYRPFPQKKLGIPDLILMLATPAKIAGCRDIVLCTPPAKDGSVNPAILVAARIAGVSRIYKIGGVQAIGAMAYGTESVPKVYKIFGPGNQFVMCAKQQVSLHDVAIDMPAGPSEVEVLADETSNVSFIAADLLSQAEHGIDSQVLLVCKSEETAKKVEAEVERQLALLSRKDIAAQALEHSKAIVVHDDTEMMDITNRYAPEHLIIETANYMELSQKVMNAGSVFLGSLTPESAGDYASGTNHTLPTNGYAVAYSGVNLDSFCRKITFQHIEKEGIRAIGRAVELMAEAEGLDAHKNAMTLRKESL